MEMARLFWPMSSPRPPFKKIVEVTKLHSFFAVIFFSHWIHSPLTPACIGRLNHAMPHREKRSRERWGGGTQIR
jgi:hypothetical protein